MATSTPLPTEQTIIFPCVSTVQKEDLVYLASNGLLTTATSNNPQTPIVGIVIAKPTAAACEILFSGLVSYSLNLAFGIIYVGIDGKLSLTPTQAGGGLNQVMGTSFGNGKIYFYPNYVRIISV